MTADRTVTATFSLDNQPPIIDTIQVSVSPTTATISWVTNEPATSRVDYGTTPVHDQFVEDPTLRTQHSLVLNNLTPGLEYHFSVTSVDVDTMSTSSPDDTFMTPSALPGSFLSDDFLTPSRSTPACGRSSIPSAMPRPPSVDPARPMPG